MGLFNNVFGNWFGGGQYVNPIAFEYYSSEFVDPIADFTEFNDDLSKLKAIFSNPAALKVFQLSCNMFSMGKVFVYKGGKEVKDDPMLDRLKKPNFFQGKNQWLWDYKFWKMIGNAYCYIDSKIVENDKNQFYWLDTSKITMPQEMLVMRDKIILSEASYKKIQDFNISYKYADGTEKKIKWSNIIHISDLTNGTGNWFKGRSRIDALYKIIGNSEEAINSKNINIRYAGKFIVAGRTPETDVSKVGLTPTEKEDVEQKMNGRKNIHAMKSLVDIKRFVETAAIVGELDESYLSDYFKIGSLFDIPKDVLEAFNSGTYENQEKARGAFVGYCLQPDAEMLTNELENYFSYTDKQIIVDWEHLAFMQVFAKERAETGFKVTQSLINLMKAGVQIAEINAILDLNLTELDYEGVKASGVVGENQGNQGENTQ